MSGSVPQHTAAGVSQEMRRPSRFTKWHRRVLGFCLVIFTLELGLFLLFFPWIGSWDVSWVPMHSAWLSKIWMSCYFRGALSGLGLLNLYIAFAELFKLVRPLFERPNKSP